MNLNIILFGILAILAISTSIVTVASKNPIVSAMSLVAHFFMLAGLYLTLQAQFIAVLQVLVYAGAIMVLVVFVIMLLNLGSEEQLKEKFNVNKVFAVIFAIALTAILLSVFFTAKSGMVKFPENSANINSVQSIGASLFNVYIVPFEAIGILLLAAIVGALVLAKRKIE